MFKVGKRYKNKASGTISWCTTTNGFYVEFGRNKTVSSLDITWSIDLANNYWTLVKEVKSKNKKLKIMTYWK